MVAQREEWYRLVPHEDGKPLEPAYVLCIEYPLEQARKVAEVLLWVDEGLDGVTLVAPSGDRQEVARG